MLRKTITYKINKNGCHICTSHFIDKKGYPRCYYKDKRKTTIARFLWEEKNGVIPKGLCALHKCDNPGCINLEHIFLGSQLDNIRDCVEKKRMRVQKQDQKGELNPNARLTPQDIIFIRKHHTEGVARKGASSGYGTVTKLAKQFNISTKTIHGIVRGARWPHIGV